MPFTTNTANKILDKVLRGVDFTAPTSLRVSLHTADPGQTGASEVSGGSYARKQPTIAAASNKASTTTADLEWTNMPACTVTHVGIWDQSGAFWWGGALTASKAVAAGDTFKIVAGDLDFNLT